MSRKIEDLKVKLDEDLEDRLEWLCPDYSSYHILKKSVDARRRHEPHFTYSVEIFESGEFPPKQDYPIEPIRFSSEAPIIVGAGPAGLFAALRLCERGIPCHIIEQGSVASERMKHIARHWRYGEFNRKDNVCFGEGGAGLFSDGKLITRIKSPHIPYVMHRLVKCGAPEEIQYLSNPHVGSDKIRRVIPRLREKIISLGGIFHFNCKVEKLLFTESSIKGVTTEDGRSFHSPHVILACGHSAEDIFTQLQENHVFLEGKSFAVGLRIEHPQELINKLQYRQHANHPKLGAANYKLTYNSPDKKVGVYSFCMCPGGYVLSSGTEANGVVCNGMSNYNRNSPFANAAIVASLDHQSEFGDDIFGGVKFRRKLEQQAYQMVQDAGGSKELPAQTLVNFLKQKEGSAFKGSSPSGAVGVRLDNLLPEQFSKHIVHALEKFNRSMDGFVSDQSQLYGVESRTSCPLRITRDKQTLESVSHQGLYPTGEGAGYAGGITSAACDGIKVAEAIVEKVSAAQVYTDPV